MYIIINWIGRLGILIIVLHLPFTKKPFCSISHRASHDIDRLFLIDYWLLIWKFFPHRASHDNDPDNPVIEILSIDKISDAMDGRLLCQNISFLSKWWLSQWKWWRWWWLTKPHWLCKFGIGYICEYQNQIVFTWRYLPKFKRFIVDRTGYTLKPIKPTRNYTKQTYWWQGTMVMTLVPAGQN